MNVFAMTPLYCSTVRGFIVVMRVRIQEYLLALRQGFLFLKEALLLRICLQHSPGFLVRPIVLLELAVHIWTKLCARSGWCVLQQRFVLQTAMGRRVLLLLLYRWSEA